MSVDFEKYASDLENIIIQLRDINPFKAVEFWEYLLNNNQDTISNSDKYGLSYGLLSGLLEKLMESPGFKTIEDEIVNSEVILINLFSKSQLITTNMLILISDIIKSNELVTANHLLEMLFNNKKGLKDMSFSDIIVDIIEKGLMVDKEYGSWLVTTYDSREYAEDVQNLISNWIDKISNKQQKAKAMISYMKIC